MAELLANKDLWLCLSIEKTLVLLRKNATSPEVIPLTAFKQSKVTLSACKYKIKRLNGQLK